MKNHLFGPPQMSRYLIFGPGRSLKPFKYKENGDFTRFSSILIKKSLFHFFTLEVGCPFRTGNSRSKWIASWIIIIRSSFSMLNYDAKMWLSPRKYQLFWLFCSIFINRNFKTSVHFVQGFPLFLKHAFKMLTFLTGKVHFFKNTHISNKF